MTVKSIGKAFQEKRKEKKLSLAEVSEGLHIRIAYLEALEHDNLETLLSPVQARGFARLYADFMEMDISDFLNPAPAPAPEEPPPSEPPHGLQDDEGTPPIEEEMLERWSEDGESIAEPGAIDSTLEAPPPVQAASAEELFKTIGNSLLSRREALGITLEEVERHTHLKSHYLKFLEAGEFDNLPSPVQGKGMLANYTRFLELDTEELLLLFADALQIRREKFNFNSESGERISPHTKRGNAKPSLLKRVLTPDLLIGGSIIALIFFFSIWTISTINAQRNKAFDATPPPISEVLSGNAVADIPSFVDITVTPPPPPSQAPQTSAGNMENGGNFEVDIPQKDDKPLQIYLITSARAWVQVIADKKTVFNGRVQPGNAYPFSAESQIELATGNAAALQVFFNQQDLGALGLSGEIARLIFTDQGILNPTPIFTPTYTPTIPPTLTLFPTPTVPSPTVTPFIP